MKFILLLIVVFCSLDGASQEIKIKIDQEQTNDGVILYATNNEFCPVSVELDFDVDNLDYPSDNVFVIPGKAQRFRFIELKRIDIKKTWKFGYSLFGSLGDINLTQYDTNYLYSLPYQTGKRFRVSQGYNGVISHQNEYSLDFNMPDGSEIAAARGGLVAKVVQNFSQSCFKEECKNISSNYILIYHSDGTFGMYAHIQFNGAKVKEGDIIKTGDVIALSGNVGYSKGPHLHFAVFLPKLFKPKTIMTMFRIAKGDHAEYLKEKKGYRKKY